MPKPVKVPEWDSGQLNTLEPTATHKASGWLIPGGVPEKPTLQEYNYWMNNVYLWLNELNQRGILAWDAVTIYEVGAHVLGTDFNVYRALTGANQNNNPVGDFVNWVDTALVTDTSHGSRAGGALHADAVPAGAAGFMSGSDKTKLNGLIGGSNVEAWVNFNGVGVVAIRDSFNVTSITDGGIGDYTVNFTTNISTANYAAVGAAGYGDGLTTAGISVYFGTPSVGSQRITTYNISIPNINDVDYISLIITT